MQDLHLNGGTFVEHNIHFSHAFQDLANINSIIRALKHIKRQETATYIKVSLTLNYL